MRAVEAALVALVTVIFTALAFTSMPPPEEGCGWAVSYSRALAFHILAGEDYDAGALAERLGAYPQVVYVEVGGERLVLREGRSAYTVRAVLLGRRGRIQPVEVVVGVRP